MAEVLEILERPLRRCRASLGETSTPASRRGTTTDGGRPETPEGHWGQYPTNVEVAKSDTNLVLNLKLVNYRLNTDFLNLRSVNFFTSHYKVGSGKFWLVNIIYLSLIMMSAINQQYIFVRYWSWVSNFEHATKLIIAIATVLNMYFDHNNPVLTHQ